MTGSSEPCAIATGTPASRSGSSGQPSTCGRKPESAIDRGRPRAAGAEAHRPAHHRALREAAEHDALRRDRQRVEEGGEARRGGVRTSSDRGSGSRRARTSGARRAAARAGRRGVTPSSRRSGSSRSSSGKRSCSSAPRPWRRTSAPSARRRRAARSERDGSRHAAVGARVGSGVSTCSTCAAQVLEGGRQDQRLAEVLRVLVDPEARGRASRARRARRSARGSRSSGTRSGRSPGVARPPASVTRRCQPSWSSSSRPRRRGAPCRRRGCRGPAAGGGSYA